MGRAVALLFGSVVIALSANGRLDHVTIFKWQMFCRPRRQWGKDLYRNTRRFAGYWWLVSDHMQRSWPMVSFTMSWWYLWLLRYSEARYMHIFIQSYKFFHLFLHPPLTLLNCILHDKLVNKAVFWPAHKLPLYYNTFHPGATSVDCLVGEWKQGICNARCGEKGFATHTREVTRQQEGTGAACPRLERNVQCWGKACTGYQK